MNVRQRAVMNMSAKNKLTLNHHKNKTLWGILFCLPGLVFFAIFYTYPILRAMHISLFRWDILRTPQFIGFQNYINLFGSGEFWNSLGVTALYVFGSVIPVLLIALPVAIMFNRSFRGRDVFLGVWYIPVIVPLTVAAILWRLMYNPSYGLLTLITEPLGFYNLRWLNDPTLALPALIILSVWRSFPYYMVILLAGLGSIPISYVEAARADGAHSLQVFWYITLPLLKRILLYVSIVSIINAFQVFALPYLMTEGGPGSATRLLPYYIYQNAFEFLRMGYASAVSVILFGVLLLLTFLQFKAFRMGKEG